MSTSDAAELDQSAGGGGRAESRATRPTRTAAARDETFGNSFKKEHHRVAETPTGQQCRPSAIRQEETHKALILRADRQEETAGCGDSKVQTWKTTGPRFTSSLFFRLSRNLDLYNPGLEKNVHRCLHRHSLTETQRAETENNSCQVNGQTSPPDTSIKVASDSPLSERIPAKKKEEVVTVVCSEQEINRDFNITHSFSKGEFGPHGCNVLSIHPRGSPRTGTSSVELEDRKDHAKIEKRTDLADLSSTTTTMLSSTVVTVLAPHWSSRLRRTKRFEGTGNSETPGNSEDVTNTVANPTHQRFHQTVDRSLTDGSQAQSRVPFLVTRRNTVGSSANSGPASLDFESKRKIIQTVSLDVNSARMDNRKRDTGAVSPVALTEIPASPVSLHRNQQRGNETANQGGLSSLSSKPTTSSLLLSWRKFNSSGRNSSAPSTVSEINPLSLSSSPSDRDGRFFTTHLSQTFQNNNAQESSKPLISQSSISYRTAETGPVLSPSSSNHRERAIFETRNFSASPTNKDAADTPFTQQPQTSGIQSSLTCPNQAFLSRGPSERQLSCRGTNKSTNLFSESSTSSPRHSPYDRSALLKTHSQPRRTTLTSTSWWKQVTQEGSLPLTLGDTANIKDKPNTSLVPPFNDKCGMAPPSLTDNKRLSSQIPNNRDNNNTTESVCKGNMNLFMKTQERTHIKQRNAEDSSDRESNRLLKQQNGSNLNTREPQKPHSLPDVSPSAKISRAASHTILTHPKELTKHEVNKISFTADVTELPPTLLNPRSSNTPTESKNKHNDNHCTSKTNSTPTPPHNMDPQRFTKPFLSLTNTSARNSQALASKTASGLPLTPNTKTSSSFISHPIASQTSIHSSSYSGSSSQIPKFTNTAITAIPKPFHTKTVSMPIPTVDAFSKTNYSPVSTASPISSFTTASHPTATVIPSPSFLTPPVTPVFASSPTTISSLLTPPATPIITSPNCSDTSSPMEEKTFSSSQERDMKKEGKRVRRVTWEDSVDLQRHEPITVEKPEPPQVPTSSPSPSRSPRSIKAPSIFSFLRSNSSSTITTPVCSPSSKTSSIQVVKGGKYRSLSSDSADLTSREIERTKQRPSDTMTFDQGKRDLTTPRHERTLSAESGTVQSHSSVPLSLPPDFSNGYKLRYSSPPYSTLMSTRSTQGETQTVTPRSPLFQQSQSNYTPRLSTHSDPVAVMTLTSKPPMPPVSLPQPLSLPIQNKTANQESSKCGVSETDKLNNNHNKNSNKDRRNDKVLLVNNRVHVSSQSRQVDETHSSSSTFVTETLVYSIKSKADTATAAPKSTTPKPLQHTVNTTVSVDTKSSQHSNTVQSKEAAGEQPRPSDQGSSGSSSAESQSTDDECSNRKIKSVLGKSRFFSVESNNEQTPKRSRFALKKSVSTPNSVLSSESDRVVKANNKMDLVLNRLKQTFSTKRSDDDMSFPWKWKRASQTPSVSGSSDISNASDIADESTKALEKQEQEKGVVLKDNEKGTEVTNRWIQNRYTLKPPSASGSTMAGDKFYILSDKSTPETDQDELNACAEHMSESKNQPRLTIQSPTMHQFDFYKDNGTDYKPTNLVLTCRDPSPGRSPNSFSPYPSQFGKSTPSPRSPFSPFSSLSPVSSFPSPEVTDDSVFYSPKLQRRRESSSPCEPGEAISLGGSRRSRASTGPPSASPGQDKESSYADLKYGIEPGKSFSVSSVLSSRPSGPGRISTGSRFMSVGDLSESALTCGGTGKDHWTVSPDWTTEYDFQPSKDCQMSHILSDPHHMRSRSLPRSLTRCLANWSSGLSVSPSVNTTTSNQAHLWSPNMNTCQFTWDTEGPPTPPPTPPLSPVSRRMSKPPSLSSSTSPSSSGSPQPVDSQSSRGHLPSRGYVSSLSTFDESSDSSSDTTTDDEYYLETGEDNEKETEL